MSPTADAAKSRTVASLSFCTHLVSASRIRAAPPSAPILPSANAAERRTSGVAPEARSLIQSFTDRPRTDWLWSAWARAASTADAARDRSEARRMGGDLRRLES